MKPIFVVKIPKNELLRENNPQLFLKNILKSVESNVGNDYHVLCSVTTEDEPKFEAFFPSDFNQVKMLEIQQMIYDSISDFKKRRAI